MFASPQIYMWKLPLDPLPAPRCVMVFGVEAFCSKGDLRSRGWSSHDEISILPEEAPKSLLSPTHPLECTKTRSREYTVRWWPPTSLIKRTQNETYLTGTLTLDYSLYNGGKIHGCCSRPSLSDLLHPPAVSAPSCPWSALALG